MLLENAIPILGIAIDDVPGFYNQHFGALSQKLGEVTTYQRYLEKIHQSLLAYCDGTLFQ